MSFWLPAYEWRGTRKPWFTNAKLMTIEMSERAASAIYRSFNLLPELAEAANDRDHLRW